MTASAHVDDWIPELVLGTLDQDTRATVEEHLHRCERCSAEAAAMGEALSLMALSLPAEPPHPTVRTSVLASVVEEQERRAGRRAEPARFSAFVDQVARFFDVTSGRARALLALLDEPAAWTPGPGRGIQLMHIQAGARFAAADAGFVRMAPGARFPQHRHVGDELGLVLEGGLIDEDGTVARAGETHDREAGSAHHFIALPDEGCVFAAVVEDGIEILERFER
jgi:putative transcriptional regulator